MAVRHIALSAVCPVSRMTRDDGARLRAAIDEALDAREIAEVDLEGARIASLSFLDEALAAILLQRTPEFVRERIRLLNVDRLVRETLNRLAHTRSKGLAPDATVF